jgi:ferredoxin--NADP+ reductase
MPPEQAQALRQRHYNATVVGLKRIHDELMLLRVRRDLGQVVFDAGQYTVLGMGFWEPRVPNVQAETLDARHLTQLVKRAYSISCPMLDDAGDLRRPGEFSFLEFYITLVRKAERPPALTPRLFALTEGDRLFVGRKAHGKYTLDCVRGRDTVVFAATGTGEAPHNAMTAELLARGHRGRIVSVTCVRRKTDLGYIATHRTLERRYPNYRYLTLTTREPENLDPSMPGYVGKQYLQDYFLSGAMEHAAGVELDPDRTHVYLCGSPDMIGMPRIVDDEVVYPESQGLIEVLAERGFQPDLPQRPGNVHYEKYW